MILDSNRFTHKAKRSHLGAPIPAQILLQEQVYVNYNHPGECSPEKDRLR